jgi:uncharacterized membrane protein YfhO
MFYLSRCLLTHSLTLLSSGTKFTSTAQFEVIIAAFELGSDEMTILEPVPYDNGWIVYSSNKWLPPMKQIQVSLLGTKV